MEERKAAFAAMGTPAAAWRKGFVAGCADRLYDRMEKLGRPPVPAGAAGAILVRRDLVLADAWAKLKADMGLKTKTVRAQSVSAAALRAGRNAGWRFSTTPRQSRPDGAAEQSL